MLKTISEKLNYSLQGITFGFIPNYGGQLQFSEDLGNGKKAITQIQFYVSILRDVYTIQILEIEESIEYNQMLKMELPLPILKEIWVSPENHRYKDLFLSIKSSLEAIIKNPIFLPYRIQQIELKNIKPPTMEDKDKYSVGDAFFRKILPLQRKDATIFGDQDFEIDKLN